MNYSDNIGTVNEIIKSNNFTELIKYDNFVISNMFKSNIFEHLIKNCKDYDVLEYFFNNALDLECQDDNGWRPIHYVAKYSDVDTVYLLFSLGVNRSVKTKKYRNQKCKFNIFKLIKLNKNLDPKRKAGLYRYCYYPQEQIQF